MATATVGATLTLLATGLPIASEPPEKGLLIMPGPSPSRYLALLTTAPGQAAQKARVAALLDLSSLAGEALHAAGLARDHDLLLRTPADLINRGAVFRFLAKPAMMRS